MENKSCLTLDTLLPLYNEKERFIMLADHYLEDLEKAKDVVSDSFIYMLEHKETLPDNPLKIKGYLLQVIKHKCLNEIRRDRIRQDAYRNIYNVDTSVLANDNVTGRIAENDAREILRIAGTKMSKSTLDIYTSCRFGDLSHKELAKLYGVSVNRIAKEIVKANKIIESIVRNFLWIALIVFNRNMM